MSTVRQHSGTRALAACGAIWLAGIWTAAAETASVPLFPIVQGGKWGYMDAAGKVAIKPQYDCAWDFSEGLACVQVGLQRGYIDAANAMVIKPQYALARPFSEGKAAVYLDAPKWGDFLFFNRGAGCWGYIDRTGKVVVSPQQPSTVAAEEFHGGVARIVFRNPHNLHHSKPAPMLADGTRLPGFDIAYVGQFSEGVVAVQRDKQKCGYLDAKWKVVIEPAFDAAGDFSQGLACVKKGTKWSYIDKEGKPAFAGEYDDAGPFAEDLAAVAVASELAPEKPGAKPKQIFKWGCIDKSGKMVIEPKYDFIAPFSSGLARVVAGGKHGYIDKSGKVVVAPKYDCGWEFSRGLARVMSGTREGYIDRAGAEVWPPQE
jgi:hypothetical protein